MPIFDYHCEPCNKDFEELVFSRDVSPECPACGSQKVEKKLSVFSAGGSAPEPMPACCGGGSCGGPRCELN